MNTDLRKKLEEAAREYADEYAVGDAAIITALIHKVAKECFNAGGEWMFKECGGMTARHDMQRIILAQCKEWMNDNARNYVDGVLWDCHMMSDLETFMNKLLGEKI